MFIEVQYGDTLFDIGSELTILEEVIKVNKRGKIMVIKPISAKFAALEDQEYEPFSSDWATVRRAKRNGKRTVIGIFPKDEILLKMM